MTASYLNRLALICALSFSTVCHAQRIGPIPASSVDSGARAASNNGQLKPDSAGPWTKFFPGECKTVAVSQHGPTSACIDNIGKVTFRSATLQWYIGTGSSYWRQFRAERVMGIPYLNSPSETYTDEAYATGYAYQARPSSTATDQGRPTHWELVQIALQGANDNQSPGAPDGGGGY